MSDNKMLLSVQNINKSFFGVQVLHDVCLDIRPGEVHALIGENGAGKSTLMKILSGVYKPDNGTIVLNNQEIVLNNPIEAQHAGISTIHQELFMADTLTVAENIFLGREPVTKFGYVDRKRMYKESKVLLNRLGLDVDPFTGVSRLSVAQKQMVKIAEALSHESKMLIMDEPTASLPEHEREYLFELIKQLVKDGISIIYISHYLEEVFRVADRCTVLRDGRNVFTKDIKDTSMQEVIRGMVGRNIDKLDYSHHVCSADGDVLCVENLSTAHKLKKVNFSIKAGEVVGLTGLMGSGRTEVARALFGQVRYEGSISIDNKVISIKSIKDAISSGIGYVPEERKMQGIFKHLSVLENMTLPYLDEVINNHFIKKDKEKEIVNNFIKQFSIKTTSFKQPIKYLSGGNQQKIILARWLIKKPRVLILDEPTRGIDVAAKADIHALISQLAESGVSIILISSDLPEVLALSDRIIVMKNGEKRCEFTRSEVDKEKIMHAAAN